MKKYVAVSIFGMLLLSIAIPVLLSAEDETSQAGVSGTPQELADLQKTLKSDRMDNLEQSVSELKETVSALSDRVQDLERTVDDYNGRQ